VADGEGEEFDVSKLEVNITRNGQLSTYKYPLRSSLDPTNRASVRRLNEWWCHIIRRTVGNPARPKRPTYHALETAWLRGCYADLTDEEKQRLGFRMMTEAFNDRFQGRWLPGEMRRREEKGVAALGRWCGRTFGKPARKAKGDEGGKKKKVEGEVGDGDGGDRDGRGGDGGNGDSRDGDGGDKDGGDKDSGDKDSGDKDGKDGDSRDKNSGDKTVGMETVGIKTVRMETVGIETVGTKTVKNGGDGDGGNKEGGDEDGKDRDGRDKNGGDKDGGDKDGRDGDGRDGDGWGEDSGGEETEDGEETNESG
jgi:hypothetical protein